MQVLLSSKQMREAEIGAVAAGQDTLFDLMCRAGGAVADCAADMVAAHGKVVVLCGPGNNGGDGWVAAEILAERGFEVEAACLRPPAELAGDAAEAARRWRGPAKRADEVDCASTDLIVDALFGSGLTRDLDGDAASLVSRINAAGRPVLAVDVPSGIDSDTGLVRGVAVRATRTVTFACRKPGHLLLPGRILSGTVTVADIGVSPAPATGSIVTANGPALWREAFPEPGAGGHKYDRGHALVLSGGPAHTGAARLAARGALRAGAGLVTLVTSARALSVNAAHLTAIMLRVCDEPDELSDLLTDDRYNALALGPALGVGEGTRAWVAAALEADRATLLDADALTSFSGQADAFADLTKTPRGTAIVLTPHEGEIRRLFAGRNETSDEARAVAAQASKLERARAAASFTGAIVVLKGPDTVIAEPGGRAAINENGSPYLATAGSGDVLGGVITGLLAQGMSGFEAACAGVWLHAEAGARFGPGLIAEDLPEQLPGVLRALLDK